MTPFLLDLLCDPATGERFDLRGEILDSGGRIVEGELVTPSGRVYPVRAGIPRFVEEPHQREGVASFGDEWNYFNFTEFKEHWLHHTVKNTFGTPEVFRNRVILDAGGGSGAQTLWMLEHGARHVILLELSHSVDDVVRRNLEPSGFRNYDIVQCSIDAPPIRAESIDGLVICHNVIQHTRSVERTARALFGLVRPGSEFVFNCYDRNTKGLLRTLRWHLYRTVRRSLSRRSFAVRMGYAHAMGLARLLPGIGYLLEKGSLCIQGDVMRSDRSAWRHLRQRYRATVLNTFDMIGAHAYQHHLAEEELRAIVAELQPDSEEIGNLDRYFSRPPPIGCALRVRKT